MILVTGASGLVGRAVVKQLLNDGHKVRAMMRTSSMPAFQAAPEGAELHQLDFETAEVPQWEQAVQGCTEVIHCAGLVHKPLADRHAYDVLNVKATDHLQTASKAANVGSFIFLSSSAVYGGGTFDEVREDAKLNPETDYARSKLHSEQRLHADPPAPLTVVLRPSLVFGEGDRGNMIALIRQINKGLYFHVAGNNARKSIIYSADLAKVIALCCAVVQPGFHVFNASNDRPVGVVELADNIAQTLGRWALPTVPGNLVRAGATVSQTLLGDRSPLTMAKLQKLEATTTLSVNRLVEATGFKPTYSLATALANEVTWARAAGILS